MGRELDRHAVFGNRFIQPPLVPQELTKVRPGQTVLGGQPDRLAERADRFIRLAVSGEGQAQAVVDRGIARLEPLRLTELVERLVPFPQVEANGGQEEMRGAELRAEGHGGLHVGLGALKPRRRSCPGW